MHKIEFTSDFTGFKKDGAQWLVDNTDIKLVAGSSSPSPENLGLIAGTRRPGSLPASCDSKCKQCEPCMPVEVSVRAAELEENEYYPQVWQCMCQENIYPP
ncbi:hypothetical protein ERO13_D02G204400v2 [Gossypium hirsutum]|uniref:Epidermal patterning factor-like protein n=1 Tax=Gossypium tomentosum TaxID=34277 RepID=A0A5D2M1S9_GOSTO|nr:hypothetical protein ERO13_D02G204400v2 [Gossypium hirsutum]TYH85301.1 hypothetical protein ES332_D02G256800v1 [Gossypium tomentosum]